MNRYVQFNEFSGVTDVPQLTMAREVLRTFDPKRRHYTLNDILQFFAILRHIESGKYSPYWSASEKREFASYKPRLRALVRAYARSTDAANFLRRVRALEPVYHTSFVVWFDRFRLYDAIPGDRFIQAMQQQGIAMRAVLAVEGMAVPYADVIADAFLDNPRNAEILIDAYVREERLGDQPLHIPGSLTDTQKAALVERYIAMPEVNLTYLRLLTAMHQTDQLRLSPKIKLQALRREEAETTAIFDSNGSFNVTYEVELAADQQEPVDETVTPHTFVRRYSTVWLENHTDYNTILQNFIYLFNYMDGQMRLTLCDCSTERGIIDRFMQVKAKHAYDISPAFTGKESMANLALMKYYDFLRKRGIALEDVIAWFFTTYIPHYFGITGFTITMPGPHATYKERCHIVAAEMEGVLHQFTLFAQEGSIDPDLLRLSAAQIRYATLPSLMDKKYAYANPENPDIGPLLFLLFDQQVGLGYMDETRSEENLFWLIRRHPVYYADFTLGRNAMIDRLIRHRLLQKDYNGRLSFNNLARVRTLYYLREADFLHYYHLEDALKTEVDAMHAEDMLVFRATLLATSEAAYYNYYLNRSQFGNGPNIRNRYSHGSGLSASNEDEHERHYCTLLKLLIILVIKINDELCIRESARHP